MVAVGLPSVDFIEAICAGVAGENPEKGVARAELQETGASGRNESHTNALAPLLGIDVESIELSVIGQVRVAGWSCGGETVNCAASDGDAGVRFLRVAGCEVVSFCSILWPKLVKVIVGKERAVRRLP